MATVIILLGLSGSAAGPSPAADLTLTGILGIEIGMPLSGARSWSRC